MGGPLNLDSERSQSYPEKHSLKDRRPCMSPVNPYRHLTTAAALAALAISSTPAVFASAGAPGPGLIGTWQVTRTCATGCIGATVLTEHVAANGNGVFQATGDVSQLLYQISSRKVLTHASTSSSLLTVKVPGQTMRGRGVAADGSTFTVIWQCIGSSAEMQRTTTRHGPTLRPMGRAIC